MGSGALRYYSKLSLISLNEISVYRPTKFNECIFMLRFTTGFGNMTDSFSRVTEYRARVTHFTYSQIENHMPLEAQ